ncbi:MAG: family 16 glycosylhydrolase [Acidimicrobiaceae bacterium]|nr:family 16 glycosylhydrolase [Acidimicrobiaceae bacterium]
MATFLASAFVPTIDLSDITPVVTVDVGDKRPTVGDPTGIAVAVTDIDGTPLPGARLELVVDGQLRDIAVADGDGRATFTLNRPTGPANEGGYDSIQVQVATTDVVSRPTGVFWQPDESRRITISVSPDSSHSGKARTITAQVVDGTTPMAGRTVELRIDGTLAGRAPTDDGGTATFTHTAPVHGPFDLAKVVLAEDRSVASDEVLISWPLSTRGIHRGNDWELVWSDEFGGTSLDASKWRAINNCPPVYLACDTDRPENVDVSDGMLHLRSLREPYVGRNNWKGSGSQFGPLTSFTEGEFLQRDFTAGRVDSTRNFTYGRFELLGKLPQGHGTFFAFWMRPRNSPYGNDAAGGEIDIAEGANIGRGGNRRGQIDAQLPGDGWGVHHVVHMGYPFTNPYELTNLPVNPAESFHLYAVEWDTASIRFYVDDKRVLTVPQSDWFSHPRDDEEPVDEPYAPFDQPFFIVINNTVGNWALETWPGNQVPDTTVFPAEFVVDYMRVYECRPPAGTSVPGPGQGCETP